MTYYDTGLSPSGRNHAFSREPIERAWLRKASQKSGQALRTFRKCCTGDRQTSRTFYAALGSTLLPLWCGVVVSSQHTGDKLNQSKRSWQSVFTLHSKIHTHKGITEFKENWGDFIHTVKVQSSLALPVKMQHCRA